MDKKASDGNGSNEFLNRRREAMIAAGSIDPSVGLDPAQLLNAEELEVYNAGGWLIGLMRSLKMRRFRIII